MRRLSTSSPAMALALFRATLKRIMARVPVTAVLLIVLLSTAQYSFAQSDNLAVPSPASVLGPHGAAGRGCGACHTAHTGSMAASIELWGRNASPEYGAAVLFGVPENYVEISPPRITSSSGEVAGILLCLSCHDGNLTPQTMMPSQSYQRKVGLLGGPAWQPVPTLLSGRYFEHPLGPDATISLTDGLVFSNGTFSVTPDSPYARFVENYGLPVLAMGRGTAPYGINSAGQPYLLCTTCHNQHAESVYPSTVASPIDDDGGGRAYNTFFFANGPYNPQFDEVPNDRAPSTTQFCRQCHMNLANEGNNALNIRTIF